MIVRTLKFAFRILTFPLRIVKRKLILWQTHTQALAQLEQHQLSTPAAFDFPSFKKNVLLFVKNMQTDESGIRFRYSEICTQPTLYSSAYVCMIYSLVGELKKTSEETRISWINYFNSFQNENDGLFYDPIVRNEIFDDSDWWGARHLALHMINAYTCLGARPLHPFRFLEPYYKLDFLKKELDENSSMFFSKMENDYDNKLMNVACLLQYQRDSWGDAEAGKAVTFIQKYLLDKINPETGIWGDSNLADPDMRSRKVQFAYHLLPIFFYDNIYSFDLQKILTVVVNTQNKFGGFGVDINSSACEDIDSIDILIRISKFVNKQELASVLQNGFRWVLANQMSDGGFVFKLNQKMVYGHDEMSSSRNAGGMFPTWFRTLSLAYLCEYFKLQDTFKTVKCPGL